MLGRNSYTIEEVAHAKASMAAQRSAYDGLLATAKDGAAVDAFEPLFFNNLALALDRYFVHRVRGVAGKDGNPLNELEMICDALMTNDGVFQASTVLKVKPETSVLKLQFGDPIRLTASQFDELAAAFFADLEQKFL